MTQVLKTKSLSLTTVRNVKKSSKNKIVFENFGEWIAVDKCVNTMTPTKKLPTNFNKCGKIQIAKYLIII